MEKIYSTNNDNILLHIIFRLNELKNNRINISPDSEFLQAACMRMSKGMTFEAHKHIYYDKLTNITQESWLVISGKVKCIFYDLDDKKISEHILLPGDCSMTFRGGHNYVILEDDTIVYEFKTGPYLGQSKDKTKL